MLWRTVKPAIVSLLESITLRAPDSGWKVEWQQGRQGFVSPTTRAGVYLRISSTREAGLDEARAADGDGLSTAYHGQREFTLEIQIVAYAPPAGATLTRAAHIDDAIEFAERIRTRIKRPTSRAALHAAGVAFVGCGPTEERTIPIDQRLQQIVTLDVFLRGAFVDETVEDQDYFDHIELTSEIVG